MYVIPLVMSLWKRHSVHVSLSVYQSHVTAAKICPSLNDAGHLTKAGVAARELTLGIKPFVIEGR